MEDAHKQAFQSLCDLFEEERVTLTTKLKAVLDMMPDLHGHHIMSTDLVWLKMDVSNRIIKRKNGYNVKRIHLKENKAKLLRQVMEKETRTYTEKERRLFVESQTAIEEELVKMWDDQVDWLTKFHWVLNTIQTQMKSYHDLSLADRKYPVT